MNNDIQSGERGRYRQCATEIWNAVAEGKKFLKGEKVVISGFTYGLRVIVKEAPGGRN